MTFFVPPTPPDPLAPEREIKYPLILGPKKIPKKVTPVNLENICALEPLDVQSDIYADVVACSVDQPPSAPSITGAIRRSLCPCFERGEVGVETSINVRSLEKAYRRTQDYTSEPR